MGIVKKINNIIANDEAKGQSLLLKNSVHKSLPIIIWLEPPKSSGITNSPKDGMKTRRKPAKIPAKERDNVKVINCTKLLAPKSDATS